MTSLEKFLNSINGDDDASRAAYALAVVIACNSHLVDASCVRGVVDFFHEARSNPQSAIDAVLKFRNDLQAPSKGP